MIFVSVGTQNRPFDRLIEAVDKLAPSIDEEIIAQTGVATYIPKQIRHCQYYNYGQMISFIDEANLIISHAGFGIIGNSIRRNKPLILVPREEQFGESVDKQVELAEYLAEDNRSIICVRDVDFLMEAILKIRGNKPSYDYNCNIPSLIDNFIAKEFFFK